MLQRHMKQLVEFTLEAVDPSETGIPSQRNKGTGLLIGPYRSIPHSSRARTLKHESEAGVEKIHLWRTV